MIAHFATIEADFEREYRIDLAADVWSMPFRRFMVLLGGLSSRSGWAAIAHAATKGGTRKILKGSDVDAYFAGGGL